MRAPARLVACTLAAAALAAGAAPSAWPVATGYAADSFHTANLEQFAREVRAATHGELVLEVHPVGTLARLPEIRAQVEAGRIPAGEVIMASLVDQVPAAGADSVPFIVRSYEDARALWREQRPALERAFAARGMVVLYAVPWPSQGLYTTRPVASTADLRGAAMRTYDATTARIAELVGARARDVPMAGVAQALADGRVDCMITSGVTGAENRAWERLKYFYDVRAWYPKNLVFANKARFDALPEDERAALREAARRAEERGWALSEAASAAALRELAAHGMHVEAPGFALREELRRHGEKFALEWVRATGRDASAILIPYYTAANR
jgi:TRAP-type C4-dicarboxylate transport system substrate-binding protein